MQCPNSGFRIAQGKPCWAMHQQLVANCIPMHALSDVVNRYQMGGVCVRPRFNLLCFGTGELRLHATIPFVISTFALASLAYHIDTSPPLAFLSLLAATSIWGSNGILYSYPAAFLQGPAAATGIALINTIGSLGGVIGPMLLGEYYSPRFCCATRNISTHIVAMPDLHRNVFA